MFPLCVLNLITNGIINDNILKKIEKVTRGGDCCCPKRDGEFFESDRLIFN